MKTNYKLTTPKDSSWTTATKDGGFIALCMDEESALQAIWFNEGKNPNHLYVVDDKGNVDYVERDTL